MPTRKMGAISELPFETARERDLYLYYQPLFSQRFAPDHIPRSSCDTTLSAFAQLATLRLSTRRALISLIDRTNEHILAEATQTLSLQSDLVHNDQDELWFGCTTLPRSLGLCEKALEILPPAKRGPCPVSWSLSPLIINDLTRDDRFKDRPFITSRPSLRFYAAMPIRTKSGFHIGTLSVMDDRPRKGLDDTEIRFLNDMVITIMAHLEMTRVKEAHRRGEKMVKGLGIFVEGRSPLHEWWLDTKTNEAWGPHDSKDGADAQSRMKGKSQSDSDSTPALKEHISVSNAMKPEVVGHFESQDSPSPRSYPKLAVDTLAKVKGHRAAESQPVLSTHRESDPISIVSSSRSQERLSCLASAPNTSTAFAPTRPSKEEGQHPAGSKQNVSTFATDLQETMLSTNLKDMFSRASNIIRECIEVDGTIFLDAAVGTFGGRTGESHRRLGRLESMGGRSQESIISFGKEERWKTPTGDTETSELSIGGSDSSQQSKKTSAEGHDEKKKTCGILGLSTAEKSGLGGDEASGSCVPVTETFLQSLLRKYPRGQVFDLCEGGALIPSTKNTRQVAEDVAKAGSRSSEEILPGRKPRESAKQAEAKAILQMLPGARNVIFSPLWDSRRERWFAGSFAWTTRARRVLTRTEDLNYLTAFGNSVMADVARLDAVAADQAKSDFISSVSHELRTPLHGILASVEFLQDTTVDLFQDSMIDTIERCGRTLLDTIQHVLDFAKINNFTKPKKKERKVEGNSREGSPSSTMGLNIDVDLSVITEDVIDAMYAGDEFQRNSSLVVADEAGGFPSEDNDSDTAQKQSVLKKERLEVIMDIGWRSNWAFNTQSGALRRILMNLFGNALKYTDAGWVKVSLQSKDIKSAPSQSQQSVITITVSDSGRGISQEFLHNHLFTPFTQENSMNPGTGLGLSIVLQIVRSLGGTIDVKSEQGVGTEVKVSLTLIQVPLLSELPMDVKYENLALSVRKNTSRLTLGLVGFDTHSSISKIRASTLNIESEPSLSLQSSLEDMATVWFDMKVAPSASWKTSPPDIYIANETPGPHGAFGGAPIIVLCSNASMHRAYARRKKQVTHRKDNGLVYFVAKPCGPHKLAKAFAFCLGIASQSRTDRRSRGSPLPTPLGNLDSPQSLFEVSLRSPGLELSVHPGEQQLRGEYFPISAGLPPRIPSRPSESSTSAADSRMVDRLKPKLLLVEDNEINLRLLETFISKNNFEYDTAVNGLLALQAFQNARRPYDIVFMDISMPVMNGMESSREIRNLERERGQKPAMIIALTGVASATAQQDAFSTGINVFLTKPVRFSELRKILNDWTPYEDMQESKAC